MSKITLEGNASGTGTFTIAAPNSNTSYTLTLPQSTGTVVVTGGAQTIEFAAGSASTPSITFTGDTNTGIFSPAADTIAFAEGGAEVARFDSSGNLGIGTSSPAQKLDVSGTSRYTFNVGNAYTVQTSINAAGSAFADDYKNALTHIWQTSGTERARIDSSGNLLVGTTSSSVTSGAGIKIVPSASSQLALNASDSTNSSNTLLMYSTGAGAYRFYVGWGGTVFATSATITAISDQRWKENIRDLDDGLEKVMALQPRKFDWKEGKGAGTKDARGFIAQEFETVFPDMIEEWKDPVPEGEEPYKAVNANLIPTLVKAIQELNAKVQTLEAQNAAFEARLAALEAK